MTSGEEARLGVRARNGFLWQGAAFGVARLSLLVSTVVLANWLGPTDFGVITLGVLVVTALTILSELGMSQALVYQPLTGPRSSSALWVSLAGSLLVAGGWVALVPTITDWLDEPGSTWMLQSLALVIVLGSLGRIPDAVLRKEMQFSRRVPGEFARGFLRGAVAVVLVVLGFGGWSLVWAETAGALAFLLVSWYLVLPHDRPRWRAPDRSTSRELLRFGLPASLTGTLSTLALNLDYIVVAGLLGTSALGVYLVGFRVPEMLIISVAQLFAHVTFPTFTRVKHDLQRLRRGYLLVLRLQATYALTAGAAILAGAPLLVPLVFEDEYSGALAITQVIAVYCVIRSLGTSAVELFKSVGRPEVGVWLGVARIVLLLPILLLATRWGILGVAVAQASVALVYTLAAQSLVARLISMRAMDLLATVRPGLLTAAPTAAAILLVRQLVDTSWSGAVIMVGVAGAVAAVCLLLADRGLVRRVVLG